MSPNLFIRKIGSLIKRVREGGSKNVNVVETQSIMSVLNFDAETWTFFRMFSSIFAIAVLLLLVERAFYYFLQHQGNSGPEGEEVGKDIADNGMERRNAESPQTIIKRNGNGGTKVTPGSSHLSEATKSPMSFVKSLTSRLGTPTTSAAAAAAVSPSPSKVPPLKLPIQPLTESKGKKLDVNQFLTILKKEGQPIVVIKTTSQRQKPKILRVTSSGELVLESVAPPSLLSSLIKKKEAPLSLFNLKSVIEGDKTLSAFFLEFQDGSVLHLAASDAQLCKQLINVFTNLQQQVSVDPMHVAFLVSDGKVEGPIDPSEIADAKNKVTEIYKLVYPKKAYSDLPHIFVEWEGREKQLLGHIRTLYGAKLKKIITENPDRSLPEQKVESASSSSSSSSSVDAPMWPLNLLFPTPKPVPAVPRPGPPLSSLPLKDLKKLLEGNGLDPKTFLEKSEIVIALEKYYASFD